MEYLIKSALVVLVSSTAKLTTVNNRNVDLATPKAHVTNKINMEECCPYGGYAEQYSLCQQIGGNIVSPNYCNGNPQIICCEDQ